MVSFRPLGDTKKRAFQSLITLDLTGVNVLIDSGWDEDLSENVLKELVDAIPSIDLILLTHATIGHTGAFCYLRHRYPQFRSIPTYATLPVIKMSQMMTLDLYRSAGLCGPFDNPDTMHQEDVESIWSEVYSLKYSQPLHLHNNPKLEGTMITAYNSGHSLGGSLWKITDNIDSVVVALDWNHARDAHLSGAFLEPKTGVVVPDLQKPSLLITSTHVSSGLALTKCRQKFLDYIDEALKENGTVLIPTSNGSRILELVLILEKHMSTNHKRVPLIYCSKFGKQTLSQASSMLEWMVPSIISDWQVQNESPFDTSLVHYVPDIESLRLKWPTGPKVVLSFGECLESGPSKEIFVEMVASDEKSSVIVNELCPPGTLGNQLLDLSNNEGLQRLNTELEVTYNSQRELSGAALEAYNRRNEAQREEAVEAAAQERRNQQLIDTSAQSEHEFSDSEEEYEEVSHEVTGPDVLIHEDNTYDYECDEFANNAITGNSMFPFTNKRRRADDYGSYLPSEIFSEKPKATKHSTPNNNSKTDNVKNAKKEKGQEGTDDNDVMVDTLLEARATKKQDEIPMEIVEVDKKNLTLCCRIAYADMNGITNMRSLQMVVKQLQPARTIALPGSVEVCQQLSQQCPVFAVGDQPVTFPRTNFSVDVRIDPAMQLVWHELYGGFSVARVAGNLQFDPHDRIKKSGALLTSAQDVAASSDEEPGKATTTVGDLRLTSLRKLLNEMGMKAEFKSQGILVCNDSVIVRKTDKTSYILEGGITPEYYKVREAIRQFITTI